jgi:hypothetical protein
MSRVHNVMVPLLVAAFTALGIHSTTRFQSGVQEPDRESTFASDSTRKAFSAADNFRNTDTYLQNLPDRIGDRRYTSRIVAFLLSR